MSPLEIKILLMRRGKTISGLARKFGCYREELSMCIRQVREYPRLRQKLANELEIPVEQLFGEENRWKAA